MILGVLSDTHRDRKNAIPHIMQEFKKRSVTHIIHCGDIIKKHKDPNLFLNLPVDCALNKEEAENPAFQVVPPGWRFTLPSNPAGDPANRILTIGEWIKIYLGHKRAFDCLLGSERKLFEIIEATRRAYDGLRWYFSGHTHHQIYMQGRLTNFVNPGAVENSLDGNYEFCVIDTENDEIVFSRILSTQPTIQDFSIGIISDSLNISQMDPSFWKKLQEEFLRRGVRYVVHCGNIALEDIGRKEMDPFTIYCNLRKKDQEAPKRIPDNWRIISKKDSVVEIEGYKFYVQLDLGAKLLELSEIDMEKLSTKIRRTYPETSFALCGFTNNAFYEEGAEINIINPGNILSRNFAVLCLPRKEITFGHVPTDPLPAVAA